MTSIEDDATIQLIRRLISTKVVSSSPPSRGTNSTGYYICFSNSSSIDLEGHRRILNLAFSTEMQSVFKGCQASLRLTSKPSSTLTRSILASRTNGTSSIFILQRKLSSTSKMALKTPSSDPPKKEMAYFPNMTTSLPSESSEFRRVLYTGLYSQLVLMTVPVGGDIGDEVGFPVSKL